MNRNLERILKPPRAAGAGKNFRFSGIKLIDNRNKSEYFRYDLNLNGIVSHFLQIREHYMEEQVEKLIVALMVLLQQQEGEVKLDQEEFQRMFEARHKMGIQVHELEEEGILLKLGEMTINPDDAALN